MWQEEEDVVDRRWAIDWDAALAPPLALIPDLSVFVSPAFEDVADTTPVDDAPPLLAWENSMLEGLVREEEECGAAFQRDSLHL